MVRAAVIRALAWGSLLLAATPSLAAPRVRLMVAVPDAAAYERVMALVHNAQLTAMDGEAFVVVGDFADAPQGHALGRALQRRLHLPFELVYDPHHPQADLAWAPASRPPQLPPMPPPLPTVAGPAEPLVADTLLYLYAEPQNQQQATLLAHYLQQPSLLADTDGVRVGVYRDTPKTRRMLLQREADLTALGIPVQRYRRSPGTSPALAAGL
jgi:hypothetical protein